MLKQDLIRQYDMLPRDGCVLCAVSGGADSMCLLNWLVELSAKYGCTVAAAHFNHGLRGAQADRDEQFVRDFCAKKNIPCYCGRGDVAAVAAEYGWSVEEAGRNLRYRFLQETAKEIGALRIATAHHMSDDAETVLLNLIRGSGLTGLCGIAPVRDIFIRPLLDTPLSEIAEYLIARGIPWVHDESNDSIQYTRNRIRREVLPLLREMNPKMDETLHQMATLLRREDAYLRKVAQRTCADMKRGAGCVSLRRDELTDLPPAMQARVVRHMLDELGASKKDISARHVQAVLDLAAHSGPKAQLSLPRGIVAHNAGEWFELCIEEMGEWTGATLYPVGEVALGTWSVRCFVIKEPVPPKRNRIILKNDAICAPVRVDHWHSTERMALPGKEGTRSLKRLFSDAGFGVKERQNAPVVYVAGVVAAVPGIGVARGFEAEEQDWKYVLDFEPKKIEKNDGRGNYEHD